LDDYELVCWAASEAKHTKTAQANQKGEAMTTELIPTEQKEKKLHVHAQSNSDAVYGLGMIGAWVFYIGRAKNFQEGVVGFCKGLVWPAFMVYELLKFLNKE
jgi:hypothetical protein